MGTRGSLRCRMGSLLMGVLFCIPAILLFQALSSGASEGRDTYERRIQKAPSNVSLYNEYVSILTADRAYETALDWIGKGLAVAPANAELRLKRGIALHALGRVEESLRTLKALPATGEARFYMGLGYGALRDHASARKFLTEAWELGFREPYLLYSLIEEDQAVGDKAAGLDHFQLLAKDFPDSPWLHVLYADAYFLKNDDAQARAEYQEALRLNPDLPGVNFRMGFLLNKSGEHAAALEYFRKEVAVNPAYSDAHLFLAEALRNLVRDEEAIPHFRRALALDRKSELAYRALASTLTKKGDLTEAADVLGEAEKEFPVDTGFRAQRILVLNKLNRREEARREKDQYLLLMQERQNRENEASKKP